MAEARRRLTDDERQHILGLYADGEKIDYIAAVIKTSKSTVSRCAVTGGTMPRKHGRPRDKKKEDIRNCVLWFMAGKESVTREDLWGVMWNVPGYRDKWDIISTLKRENKIVSIRPGVYRLVEEKAMGDRDVKQDIFEEVLSVLLTCKGRSIDDVSQETTDKVWNLLVSVGVAGKQKEPEKPEAPDGRKEAEKKAVEAVERIRRIRDGGAPDPTNGGFFI